MHGEGLTVVQVDFNTYISECIKTSAIAGGTELLRMATLGFGGERGEVLELLKKHVYHGHTLDQAKLAKELGDVMWYLAVFSYGFCKEILGADPKFECEFRYKTCETALDVVKTTSRWQSVTNRVEEAMIGASCFGEEEVSVDDCVRMVMAATHELLRSTGPSYSVDQVLRGNIEKLRARYPNGFSTERSKNRVEGDT